MRARMHLPRDDDMSTDSSFSEFAKRLLLIVVVALLILITAFAFQIFLLIFAGILLATFLYRTGQWLASHTKLSRNWSIALFVVAILALLVGLIVLASPRIAEQASLLGEMLPKSWEELRQRVNDNAAGGWLLERLPDPEEVAKSLGGVMKKATGWAFTFFGGLFGLLVVLVLGLYLAFGADTYVAGTLALVPRAHRGRAEEVLHALSVTLHRWLVGRILEMAFIGVSTSIGLLLLGVPLPFALGMLAAVLTFIPNIGPILALVPALLLAAQNGWMPVLYVAILYTSLQALESYILTPLVQRQMISMPPALVIAGQILLAVFAGILGVLLATPLIAALIVIVKLLYVQDTLHDEVEVKE